MGESRVQKTKESWKFYDSPAPQTITTGAVSAVSTAVLGHNEFAFITTSDCFFVTGTTPVATTADHFMPSGAVWPIIVDPEHKVAVISPSGAGAFYISAIG
jgi:hypothetical protein